MPLEQLTFHEWAKNVFKITLDPSSKEIPAHNSRYRGAALVFLGFLKFSFMNLLVEPFLPSKTVFGLYYSWFHPMSLIYTLLYGLKIYCTLGGMDIVLGIEQMITGWNMLELFDSPILATSPRDFWSVRWNRTVRNLLHSQVFSEGKRIEIQEEKKLGYELSEDEEQEVLVIVETSKSARKRAKEQQKNEEEQMSGIFHELLVMSACRKLTLENITFFLVQGVVVALEVALRQGALKQKPEGKTRVVCIAAQLTFMMITGRLFLGPFLRYGFI
ncbi:hypothetical protein G6F56_003894 [Rhizopus delemar]|nr:hypothetical protein G6F56_003894 [Rhizopus delemar]